MRKYQIHYKDEKRPYPSLSFIQCTRFITIIIVFLPRGSWHRIRGNPVPIRLRTGVKTKTTSARCTTEILI